MRNKVLKLIEEYSMIEQGDSVVVGFSGGADSTALLHLLFNMKEYLGIKEISAVHINHKLRGAESDQDQEFCRRFCEKLSIPFFLDTVDVLGISRAKKFSTEQAAREARYQAFSRYSDKSKIATAHTLSDSVETTIINLARGTGSAGLAGIPAVRGNIIRPILSCTREEIEEYCRENQLDYCTDSTNLKGIYTRNKIRLEIVPKLKEINSSFENRVGTTQRLLKTDGDFLEKLAREAAEKLESPSGYNRKEFLLLEKAIWGRVLRQILEKNSVTPNYENITLVYEMIVNKTGGLQLSSKKILEVAEVFFRVKTPEKLMDYFEKTIDKKDLEQSKTEINPKKTVSFKIWDCKEFENIEKNYPERLIFLLDYDKIALNVKLRQRIAGDKFRPAKRGITKTIKKLLNDEKLSLRERSQLLVIESAGEVVWVEGFGASETAVIGKTTRKTLEIVIEHERKR